MDVKIEALERASDIVQATLHDGRTLVLRYLFPPFDLERVVLFDAAHLPVIIRPGTIVPISDRDSDPEDLIEFLSAHPAHDCAQIRSIECSGTETRKHEAVTLIDGSGCAHETARTRRKREGMMAEIKTSDILTAPQAADEAGFSVRTIYDWIDKGILPHRKTASGRIRIHRKDLLACLGFTQDEIQGRTGTEGR